MHRILIVEDEYLLALDISAILEDAGYSVDGIALTGEDAVERVAASRPSLVFMDIQLDGKLSGIETAEIIKERYGVPVVFLTGNLDQGTLNRVEQVSHDGFIRKPFDEFDIIETVRRVLGY